MADDETDVERALRRYCATHPRAADSVAGVQQWWLDGIVVAREHVERVLASLVARGVLGHRRLADGTVVYFCSCGGEPS